MSTSSPRDLPDLPRRPTGLEPTLLPQGDAPPAPSTLIDDLVALAARGLAASFIPETGQFAQTVRAVRGTDGVELVREGQSLRYASIAALGLSRLPEAERAAVLGDTTVSRLIDVARRQATETPDPGAIALTAWAVAEADGSSVDGLLARLDLLLSDNRPLPTVDVAWMLTAAIAAQERVGVRGGRDRSGHIIALARDRLLNAQGPTGIFPHALPARSMGRWRAHVGCFADQVYPIQALARLAVHTNDRVALHGANSAARRICDLQGPAGQWWWHYDARLGSVVEGYPVYSVHQHAMAPMALLELLDANGDDHTDAVILGLGWLDTHPEVIDDLINDHRALIWRKVGRREPAKAARKLSAVTTSLRPGWRLPGLDAVMPPNRIDHECRPYELGWLLYTWGAPRRVGTAPATADGEG